MRAWLGLSGFREPVLRHRELMFIEVLVRGRTLCVPSRPRGDPGGGCHRWRAAKVQSSSGVTGRLTRVEASGLSASAASLGGAQPRRVRTRRVSSCEREAGVRKPSWLHLVREERAPVRGLPPGSLLLPAPRLTPTRPARLSRESPPAGSPPGRGRQAGAPLAPPTHTQRRVLVVSAPAPTHSRLFPAGDSVCLSTRVGPSP